MGLGLEQRQIVLIIVGMDLIYIKLAGYPATGYPALVTVDTG